MSTAIGSVSSCQLSRKLVPDRDADEHAHARLLGDQRAHGGDPLVGVGDAGGAQDLGLMGGAEPVGGLERLVEDPLQLRRGARPPAAGPRPAAAGSLSASTAASSCASVYSGTARHHRRAMPPALTSLSHGAGCGCKLSAADLRPIVAGLPLPDRPARARRHRHRRRRRRRAAQRRPRARADRRLLHPDRRRPVRVRAHRRHERAVGHLRDGRRAGVGAQPRRVPARDARAGGAARRSCAAAPTRSPRRARASSAATRSTTPSPSTGSR